MTPSKSVSNSTEYSMLCGRSSGSARMRTCSRTCSSEPPPESDAGATPVAMSGMSTVSSSDMWTANRSTCRGRRVIVSIWIPWMSTASDRSASSLRFTRTLGPTRWRRRSNSWASIDTGVDSRPWPKMTAGRRPARRRWATFLPVTSRDSAASVGRVVMANTSGRASLAGWASHLTGGRTPGIHPGSHPPYTRPAAPPVRRRRRRPSGGPSGVPV